MKNKYFNLFSCFFAFLGALIFIYHITGQTINTILFSILSILLIVLIIKYNDMIGKILKNKYIMAIVIAIPILIRFGLLMINYPIPVSDEGTFFHTASSLSINEVFNPKYIASFPYLFGYISFLSVPFKIIGSSKLVAILCNIILDVIGAFFVYKTMKKIYNKKAGLITGIIWLYNPINIIWCSKILPVIIVNTSLIISVYLFTCLINNFDNKYKYIILSILTGIMLGITNNFRPIMIIFIIALFLYYIFLALKKYKLYKLLLSLLFILIPYKLMGNINNRLVEEYTNYKIGGNGSGWTIYVGSNYSTSGQWFLEPEFNEHTFLQFFGNDSTNLITTIFKFYINLFWFLILIVTFIFSYDMIKSKDEKMLIYIILILGFFSSNLLVEVSPRYFTPMLVPLTLISGYSIVKILNNKYVLGGKK